MKPKMQHHVQPRESLPRRNEQASEEIEKFLRAVESYPESVAQEPSLTFRQHLASLFESGGKNPPRN